MGNLAVLTIQKFPRLKLTLKLAKIDSQQTTATTEIVCSQGAEEVLQQVHEDEVEIDQSADCGCGGRAQSEVRQTGRGLHAP